MGIGGIGAAPTIVSKLVAGKEVAGVAVGVVV